MVTVRRLVAIGVLLLAVGSGARWWTASGEPDAPRAERAADPIDGASQPLSALLQRAANAQGDVRVDDASAPGSSTASAPAAAASGAEPAYDPLHPDPRQRRHALERWARTLGASADVAAMAMLDPDESIRERAQQLFEARLVADRSPPIP